MRCTEGRCCDVARAGAIVLPKIVGMAFGDGDAIHKET